MRKQKGKGVAMNEALIALGLIGVLGFVIVILLLLKRPWCDVDDRVDGLTLSMSAELQRHWDLLKLNCDELKAVEVSAKNACAGNDKRIAELMNYFKTLNDRLDRQSVNVTCDDCGCLVDKQDVAARGETSVKRVSTDLAFGDFTITETLYTPCYCKRCWGEREKAGKKK
jgi:hypothetical protein